MRLVWIAVAGMLLGAVTLLEIAIDWRGAPQMAELENANAVGTSR